VTEAVGAPVELRPTIDRAWLEAAAAREPVDHAYELWDLDRFPDRIRIVSAVRDERMVGYLLVWLGLPGVPFVHWHGIGPGTERLAEALPPRPLVAVVPPEAVATVVAARGDARSFPQRTMLRPADRPAPAPPASRGIRRLARPEAPQLWSWARDLNDPLVTEYVGLDPDVEAVWGAFDGDRLVGAARAAVRLPTEWIVAGVFVEPAARRRGFGEGLVRAVVGAAGEHGARVGLYVREDRADARRLYERLGFRSLGRRVWLDLGAGLAP